LENSYYSVISPEGCAAILWKDGSKAPEAAAVLKLTGEDLIKLKVIDAVIPEPFGGAHRDPEKTAQNVREVLIRDIKELKSLKKEVLLESRYYKFRNMGIIA
jgi:acetyl-CoA carboxylase carboxyl transferase subunit alpha